MQFVPLVLFVAVHLKNCFLFPSCHLTLMSFCSGGLARSCRIYNFKKQRKTFSLWRRFTSERMRRVRKCFCLSFSHRLGWFPLSRRERVNFWMMDSATSPFGSAQNDRVGGTLRRVKFFGLNKPTKRKSGAMCMS